MNGQVDGQMDRQLDEQINGQTDGQMERQVDRQMKRDGQTEAVFTVDSSPGQLGYPRCSQESFLICFLTPKTPHA